MPFNLFSSVRGARRSEAKNEDNKNKISGGTGKDSGISAGSDSHSTIQEEEDDEEEEEENEQSDAAMSSNGSNDGDSEASLGEQEHKASSPERRQLSSTENSVAAANNIDKKRKMYRKKRRETSSSASGGGNEKRQGGDESSGEEEDGNGDAKSKKDSISHKEESSSPSRRRRKQKKDANAARKSGGSPQKSKGTLRREGTAFLKAKEDLVDLSLVDSQGRDAKGGLTRHKVMASTLPLPEEEDAKSVLSSSSQRRSSIAPGEDPIGALLETDSMQNKKRRTMEEEGLTEMQAEEKLKGDVKHAVGKVVAISAKGAYESGAAAIRERQEQLENELGKLGLVKAKSRKDVEDLLLVEDEAKVRQQKRERASKKHLKKRDYVRLPSLQREKMRDSSRRDNPRAKKAPQSPTMRSQSLNAKRMMKREENKEDLLSSPRHQKSRSLSPLKREEEGNQASAIREEEEESNRMGHNQEGKGGGEAGGMMIVNRKSRLDGSSSRPRQRRRSSVKKGDVESLKDLDEEFHPDEMPAYARSYILPRVMKRSDVLEARRRRQERKKAEKKKSLETTGLGKRKVSSYVNPDEAADERFKWGMIKASLEYESTKLPLSLREDDEEDDRKKRVPGKNESAKDFASRTGRLPPPNSLLPVKGPGQLHRYIRYVKEENYVPAPVLEPEKAVDHGLFAKKKSKKWASNEDVDTSSTSRTTSRASNLTQAHCSITAQYENIVKQVEAATKATQEFKESLSKKKKKSSIFHSDLETLENIDLNVPQVSRATSRNTSRASSRVSSRVSSAASSVGSPKKGSKRKRRRKKGRLPLPSIGDEFEDDVLLEEPELEEELQESKSPAPNVVPGSPVASGAVPGPSRAGDSGYSSFPTSVDAASVASKASKVEDEDLFGIGIKVPRATLLSVEEEVGGVEAEDEELDRLMREAMRIARESKLLGVGEWEDDMSTEVESTSQQPQGQQNEPPDYIPKDSEAYREWVDANLLQDAMQGRNLLGMLEEQKPRFNDESLRLREGERPTEEELMSTIDLFIDRNAPFNHLSERHPVLQQVLTLIQKTKTDRAEKLQVQEDLFRARSMRREGELRREYLLNKAKILQARATKHKARLSVLWEEKLSEESEKTRPLEEVCAALREELDAAHRQRIEAFEIKMKPIIIRDGPSKKANYKIQAARLHYEIYALTQRLRHAIMRAEHEEQRRERREREVKLLREEISDKKTAISTITKGIPFTKLEVRPDDQLPPSSFNLIGTTTSKLLPVPTVPTSKASMIIPLPRSQVMAPPSMAAGVLSQQQLQLQRLAQQAAAAAAGGHGQTSISSSVTSLPRIGNGNGVASGGGGANGRIPNGGSKLPRGVS